METSEFVLDVVDRDGVDVELRFTGSVVVHGSTGVMYLTDEGNVVLVDDEGRYSATPCDDVGTDDLEDFFGQDREAFGEACRALGIKPIIEL